MKLPPTTGQDMLISVLTKNTDFVITAAADAPQGAIGRVAGGAIAIKILEQMDISILAYSQAIGPVSIDPARFDPAEISKNKLYMPDATAAAKASAYLEKCLQEQNSSGGIIECQIFGLPVGLGDPVFEKLDANLAKAILSIGAVKGFEIGAGFGAATATGLTNNDAFCMENGHISKRTNYSGGTLGGMSDGSLLFFRAAVKPTPSIAATQQTVNKDGKEIEISIKGRHDPIIVPRAVVVVEAMTAITILDALLSNMTARLDRIIDNRIFLYILRKKITGALFASCDFLF